MTARIIVWDGTPLALLVEEPSGTSYIIPPLCLDADGAIVEGRELCAAIVETGMRAWLPIIRDVPPALVAIIDQALAGMSEQLGVPIGPPDSWPNVAASHPLGADLVLWSDRS